MMAESSVSASKAALIIHSPRLPATRFNATIFPTVVLLNVVENHTRRPGYNLRRSTCAKRASPREGQGTSFCVVKAWASRRNQICSKTSMRSLSIRCMGLRGSNSGRNLLSTTAALRTPPNNASFLRAFKAFDLDNLSAKTSLANS